MSSTMSHTKQIKEMQDQISKLFSNVHTLHENKTNLKDYNKKMEELTSGLHSVRETALNSESLTQTMVEFIHKFEPIYI